MSTKRGEAPEGYYTASQAKKRLGNISDGKFRYDIKKGRIKRIIPPGMIQGFYLQEEIDHIARSFDNFLTEETSHEQGAQFCIASSDDMPELVYLLIEIFGGGDTTAKRLKWLERNPEIAFFVRSRGTMVGCVFLLPLTEEKIEAILNSQAPGSTGLIEPEDIQPYEQGVPVSLYVVSMGVKPSVTATAKRARGLSLIRGVMRFLIELGHRGIPIKLIAARSDSPDGINLLIHARFTEVESNTKNRNFIIDVPRSGLPPIMQYKRAYRVAISLAEY